MARQSRIRELVRELAQQAAAQRDAEDAARPGRPTLPYVCPECFVRGPRPRHRAGCTTRQNKGFRAMPRETMLAAVRRGGTVVQVLGTGYRWKAEAPEAAAEAGRKGRGLQLAAERAKEAAERAKWKRWTEREAREARRTFRGL